MFIAIEPEIPGKEAGIEGPVEIEISFRCRAGPDDHDRYAIVIGPQRIDHID
jgi:hypothetical protein